MKLTTKNCLEILKGAEYLDSKHMLKKCEDFVLTQPEAFKEKDFGWTPVFQDLKKRIDEALNVEIVETEMDWTDEKLEL